MPTAEKQLDWTALIETALTAPGSVGNTYNRFYTYSFMNQILLLMQGVNEPVATYKRWGDLGRQVVKGSKAKEIVRPIVIVKKDEAGEVESKFMRFKPVRCLFGYSETEGEDLPEVEPPGWDLNTALAALDIERVPFANLNGNIGGYSVDRQIAINPAAPDALSTTFHELGHVVLGHTTPDALAEYGQHRGVCEFQAEAVAYLAMHELEQLTEDQATKCRGYIQGWLRKDRPADAAIKGVFKATDSILRAGRA